MNSLITFTVFLAVCCLVYGQEQCVPVGGGYGLCINIYNCDPLLAILNKKDRTSQDIDVLRKSQCGFDGSAPAVCCPQDQPVTPAPANQCFTPDGKSGQCISLYQCPNIANLLKPPVPNEKIQYVQRSRCQGPDQYSVCCGPAPSFQQIKPGNCAATMTAFPPDPKTECCGLDARVGNKIVGGAPATIDQYPWLAIIEYVKDGVVKTLCGGALISGKYVLTAAHCVVGQVLNIGKPTNVRLGEYDTSHEGPDCAAVEAGGEDCTDGAVRIPIEKTIPHAQYNPLTVQKQNDIALLRLKQMAPFTEFIRPICLPSVDMTSRTDSFLLTAAGWGAVSTRQSSSPIKLHVELPFVPKDKCQPAYAVPGRNVSLWHGQFCAGGQKGKDSCKGDSGGPLMYENGRIYEAIGVVSFGPLPCGLENIPGIYTNVYDYDTWIRSNITP